MFEDDQIYSRVDTKAEYDYSGQLPAHSSLSLIASRIQPGVRVLDVGCGAGRLAAALKSRGAVVTGIERNPVSSRLALEHCERVLEIDVQDADSFPTNERFDAIVCADVLEHLPRPDIVLKNLNSLLNDDGRLFVSVPNIAHYSVRLALARGNFDYQAWGVLDKTHLRFFTRKTLLQMLQSTGFEDIWISGAPIVPLGRLERYWKGMRPSIASLRPTLFFYQWVVEAVPTSRNGLA